jgi:hypothetical protein
MFPIKPKKNVMDAQGPSKPAPVNPSKPMTSSSLKIGSPEIRVPLASGPKTSNMNVSEPKMPKDKKRLMKLPKRLKK